MMSILANKRCRGWASAGTFHHAMIMPAMTVASTSATSSKECLFKAEYGHAFQYSHREPSPMAHDKLR
jgi:hypothetical protein